MRALPNLRRVAAQVLAALKDAHLDVHEVPPSALASDALLTVEFEGVVSRFLVETKDRLYPSTAAPLLSWVNSVETRGKYRPLVYANYIGTDIVELLRQRGVSYLDGAGNCMLRGCNFVVSFEGRKQRLEGLELLSTEVRLSSLKVSRLVRCLLTTKTGKPYGVKELAETAIVSPSYTSEVLQSLAQSGFVQRSASGSYTLADPASLLDRWVAVSKKMWRKPLVLRVFAESADKLIGMLTKAARGLNARYAMTLWSAVNAFSWSTVTETAAFYADSPESLLEAADFEHEVAERGENLWLMQPRDEGVYYGSKEIAGVRCVHPVQLYYDLSFAPHRGKALAEKVREELLGF